MAPMTTPAERRRRTLSELISRDGLAKFARIVGKSPQQISDMLAGRKSFGEKVARNIEETYWPVGPRGWLESEQMPPASVADRLIGGDVLAWDSPEDLPDDEDRVWVDRWDYSCSAGDGSIQWDIRKKSALPFTRAFFQTIGSKPENCKLLTTRGDSMEPFLYNKDTIMVDTSKTQIRDGVIYAICFEDEALVKRVYKQAGGILVLNSFNSTNYPDKIVDPSKASQFEIIGEVVYRSGAGFSDT